MAWAFGPDERDVSKSMNMPKHFPNGSGCPAATHGVLAPRFHSGQPPASTETRNDGFMPTSCLRNWWLVPQALEEQYTITTVFGSRRPLLVHSNNLVSSAPDSSAGTLSAPGI